MSLRARLFSFLMLGLLSAATFGLVACGGDDDGDADSTATVASASPTAAAAAASPAPATATAAASATSAPEATSTSAALAPTATAVVVASTATAAAVPTATLPPAPTATSAAPAPATFAMTVIDFGYAPQSLSGQVGQTLTVNVSNNGNAPHSFTIDGLGDSGVLSSGGQASVTLTPAQAGSYTFYCVIHGAASMSGVLTVQ